MIVLVTGGRDYVGDGLVAELERVDHETPIGLLVVGDARGADTIAYRWGLSKQEEDSLGLPRVVRHVADWNTWGLGAGPIRNQEMVDTVLSERGADEVVLCLAAPGGRGTADCVRRALLADFEVRRVT